MSPCTVCMISCAIEQYYLWPNGKNVFFYSSFSVMGLLPCSFVFLPFSEPARVLSSPVSLSGTAQPNGSEFACLPRKVSQSTGGENTAEASMCTELLSPRLLLHYCDMRDAHEPDVPFTPKSSSSIACPKPNVPRHQLPSVLLCHFAGALKPM